ncbi:MAG: hypothetical protein JJ913_08830 [Rhizobiaceae bacterium]|nr:hypothetical protein [Rhizobiaceae bacterium]
MRAGLLLVSIVAAAAAGPASATTQNVLFDATVNPVCTLSVDANGTLAASVDLQSLSSKLAGGSAGTVTLSTTGGVDLSVDPVTVVTVPAADVTATTWTPTYSATGTHTIGETGNTTALADAGTSTLTVHLVGTKGGSNRFAAGNYQATVTVRCE